MARGGAEPAAPARCAQCGAALEARAGEGPRLRLFCRRCRDGDRPDFDAAPAPARDGGMLRARWPSRRVLRLLLLALALCIALIRLLAR